MPGFLKPRTNALALFVVVLAGACVAIGIWSGSAAQVASHRHAIMENGGILLSLERLPYFLLPAAENVNWEARTRSVAARSRYIFATGLALAAILIILWLVGFPVQHDEQGVLVRGIPHGVLRGATIFIAIVGMAACGVLVVQSSLTPTISGDEIAEVAVTTRAAGFTILGSLSLLLAASLRPLR